LLEARELLRDTLEPNIT